jgi:hypothetical protein
MKRSRETLSCCLLAPILVVLLACGLPLVPEVTPTDAPRPATITPAPTPSPRPACAPGSTLGDLLGRIPYEESAVHFMAGPDFGIGLVIWFVNPHLDAPSDSLQERAELAIQASDSLVTGLLAQVPCISQAFDKIETIEVDSSYVGWVSILYSDLEGGLAAEVGYVIEEEPVTLGEVPPDRCSWRDARAEAQAVSVPDSNRAVYLVRDRAGTNIWVLWSRPETLALEPDDYFFLIALDMPLRFACLYPQADQLWLIMKDPDGFVVRAEQIPGDILRSEP